LKAIQSGLTIERESGVCEHSITTMLFNIDNTLRLKGNLDEALSYYHEAYKLAEKTSRGPSEMCITIKTTIAQICQKQERHSNTEREVTSILNLWRSQDLSMNR